MTTISRLYDSNAHAQSVVGDVKALGIPAGEISMIANRNAVGVDVESSGAAIGATVGAAVGGGAGLLAGLGIMAIPGVGPVVAAGWLAATLAGVVAGTASGGLIGALTDIGHTKDDAELYAEGLRRGGTLVTVRTNSHRDAEIAAVMDKSNPVDTTARRSEYRNGGWKGYDQNAVPHSVTDAERDRQSGSMNR